jgi:hypothetical protein
MAQVPFPAPGLANPAKTPNRRSREKESRRWVSAARRLLRSLRFDETINLPTVRPWAVRMRISPRPPEMPTRRLLKSCPPA